MEVVDQNSAVHHCAIVDMDLNFGVTAHWAFPIRFAYDWSTSQPGDSGALICGQPCGEPAGMHQGTFDVTDPAGNVSNIAYALCLYQLEDYGGMEVHQ